MGQARVLLQRRRQLRLRHLVELRAHHHLRGRRGAPPPSRGRRRRRAAQACARLVRLAGLDVGHAQHVGQLRVVGRERARLLEERDRVAAGGRPGSARGRAPATASRRSSESAEQRGEHGRQLARSRARGRSRGSARRPEDAHAGVASPGTARSASRAAAGRPASMSARACCQTCPPPDRHEGDGAADGDGRRRGAATARARSCAGARTGDREQSARTRTPAATPPHRAALLPLPSRRARIWSAAHVAPLLLEAVRPAHPEPIDLRRLPEAEVRAQVVLRDVAAAAAHLLPLRDAARRAAPRARRSRCGSRACPRA